MEPIEIVIKLAEQALKKKEPDYWGDLIKIGLPIVGTIIGGVIGYFSTRKLAEKNYEAQIKAALVSRSTELDARLLETKLAKFEELQNLIDLFVNYVADYCASVKNWKDHLTSGNEEKQEKTKKKVLDLQTKYYDGFLLLNSAESKLLLLGQYETHDKYKELNKLAKYIYETVYMKNYEISNNEIDELVEKFKEVKVIIFKQIGKNMESEHNKLLQRTYEIRH